MTTAFLFPGQGAQHVGMGRQILERIPAAKRLFDEARRKVRAWEKANVRTHS